MANLSGKTPNGRPALLNFITSNEGKLREFRAIMSDLEQQGVLKIENRNVDVDEVQGTVEEVARAKCKQAAEVVKGAVLTEDTALEFNALNGLPGPYIKYFLHGIGHDGLNKILTAYDDKTAVAVCTFGFCAGPGAPPILFQGRTQGKIVPARGPNTFGWDPVFEYDGETYAEMDKDKKNSISHRGKALAKLKAWLAGAEVDTA